MAHFDSATNDFMSEVSGETEKKMVTPKFVAKQTLGLIRDLKKPSRGQVEAAIAKRVMSLATKTHLNHMEKKAGVSALGLYHTLNENYGSDWQDWEPETLWQTLKLERGIEPSPEVKNLAQALQVTCKTDFPFEDFSTFENVSHAFNMNTVMFDTVQPCEPDDIALTIRILETIRPKEEFEDDVLGYIAACCLEAGLVALPLDLFPAGTQEFLDKMSPYVDPDLVQEALLAPETYDTETAVGVQRERIKEIREYLEDAT